MTRHLFTAAERELAKQVLLLFGQVGRRVNDEAYVQVSPTSASNMGNAVASKSDLASGLSTWRNREVLFRVQRLDLDVGTKRSLAYRQMHRRQQIHAVALESVVWLDLQVHVEIALNAASQRRGALASNAKCCAVIDAGRNLDRHCALGDDSAIAATTRTRRVHDFPNSLASLARHCLDDLTENRLANPAYLAGASAFETGDGL